MRTANTGKRLFGLVLAAAGLVFTSPALALRVTPGSKCESYCMDVPDSLSSTTTTNASDIVCSNEDFWYTTTGTKFRNCVDCLQSSTATNGSETDTEYYLYNVRYALNVCLNSSSATASAVASASSKCASSYNCQIMKKTLDSDITTVDNKTQYDYCTVNDGAFVASLGSCQTCLGSDTNRTYLANFLTALNVGCKQKPSAGTALGLNSTLFTTTAVGMVDASGSQANQTGTGATDSGGLSRSVTIGIAVACVALFALAIGLFYWLWRVNHTRPLMFMPSRPIEALSNSGAYTPFYTTDYKQQAMQEQRNYELYGKIKTQHVVVPARDEAEVTSAGVPLSSTLWGRDTPRVIRKQIEETQTYLQQQQQLFATAGGGAGGGGGAVEHRTSLSTMAASVADAHYSGQALDSMPTHPAYMPRAITRPSRNPVATPAMETAHKSYKPDDYAAQQYLDGTQGNADVAGFMPMSSEKPSKPEPPQFTFPHTLSPIFSPEPTPRSVADHSNDEASISLRSRSISPNTVPLLKSPDPPKKRGSKKNVPPPIDIPKIKAKAKNVDEPQTNQP